MFSACQSANAAAVARLLPLIQHAALAPAMQSYFNNVSGLTSRDVTGSLGLSLDVDASSSQDGGVDTRLGPEVADDVELRGDDDNVDWRASNEPTYCCSSQVEQNDVSRATGDVMVDVDDMTLKQTVDDTMTVDSRTALDVVPTSSVKLKFSIDSILVTSNKNTSGKLLIVLYFNC